jgi:hypothetical protein
MSDAALDLFRASLFRHGQVGDLQQEVLRHEMNATLNRQRLTGQQEGMFSFNTSQLCWLVKANPTWPRDHFMVVGLFLSALIDEEQDIFFEAMDQGILPPTWTWVSWAKGFQGNADELLQQIATISDMRARCGAVSLATYTAPKAIGPQLLRDFCHPPLAKVYHRLLTRALSQPSQPNGHAVAESELKRLATHLEVLFACDTDAILAKLVQASDVDYPEKLTAPFKDAAGEWTLTAIASRHLERGRAAQALAMIKDLRLLSPAYDQAVIVAALAALECGQSEQAEFYARNIDSEETRLKIVTRIAQATGDVAVEMDALSRLYEIQPQDPQIFVQLINALIRTNHLDLIAALCADAQERFIGNQQVDTLIQRFLIQR